MVETLKALSALDLMTYVIAVLRGRPPPVSTSATTRFAVPLFVALHFHIYGRWFRERAAAQTALEAQGGMA